MEKRIILSLALLATMQARADYIFANATGHLREGYPVEIQDKDGNIIKTLESGQSVSVKELPSYKLQAFKESGKEKGRMRVVNPVKYDHKSKDPRNVIVINVRNLTNRLVTHQMTLERAKKGYGKRVAFSR